jgi:hypothetical protein
MQTQRQQRQWRDPVQQSGQQPRADQHDSARLLRRGQAASSLRADRVRGIRAGGAMNDRERHPGLLVTPSVSEGIQASLHDIAGVIAIVPWDPCAASRSSASASDQAHGQSLERPNALRASSSVGGSGSSLPRRVRRTRTIDRRPTGSAPGPRRSSAPRAEFPRCTRRTSLEPG